MNGPPEPQRTLEITARAKKQIRKRMKALRGGFGTLSLARRSKALTARLLCDEEFLAAKGVASFWPMEGQGELDLRELHRALRDRGIRVYYPFMDPKADGGFSTGFRLVDEEEQLSERGRGFKEPPFGAPTARPGDIDIVLVPALAADAYGMRIGYGAGYYDATLGDVCPPASSWTVAYQFQVMAELPFEAHDRACDRIITDEKSYRAQERPVLPDFL